MTKKLDAALAMAAEQEGPATIALMRVLIEAENESDAHTALDHAITVRGAQDPAALGRLQRLRSLWQAHPQAWTIVRSTIAEIDHGRGGLSSDNVLRYWADAFDRLAVVSPEASVALYSFGSPDLLAETTAEIVERMHAWTLLRPDSDALDIGCGIGRFLMALAPRLQSIIGLDISPRMVAEARTRCAGLSNVRIAQSEGRDLNAVADASVDLVLAADVFPYLVEAGGALAATHVAEINRVLRQGGHALILNYSYRGDRDADRRDVAALADAAGLSVKRNGTQDFRLWDGATFLLSKPVA